MSQHVADGTLSECGSYVAVALTTQDFYGRDVPNPVHLTVDTTMTNNEMAIEVRDPFRPTSASR
jgi:hypothetical protein